MDKIIGYLIELGLSEKEAGTYVALLELNKGTAYAIAKHSGLKRPTVYLILEELRKKGLILKIPHARNQVFMANNPDEFFNGIENKLYQAKRIIPTLLQQYKKNNMAAHLFDGKTEMKKALEYRREELKGKEVLSFCGIPRPGKKVPGIYYEHARVLGEQETRVRVIAPDDKSIEGFNKESGYNQRLVSLPKDSFLPKVSVEITDDYSKIFLYSVSQALVIENREFSHFMKQVFELLWARGGKKKRK